MIRESKNILTPLFLGGLLLSSCGISLPEPGDSPPSLDGTQEADAADLSFDVGPDVLGDTGIPLPNSCLEVLDRGNRVSGPFVIRPPNQTAPLDVYCEQEIEGGGWLLIGRSQASGQVDGGFGWNYETGAVNDPDHPYSLGVGSRNIFFDQVLITSRLPNTSHAVGGESYMTMVPAEFFSSQMCWNSACPLPSPVMPIMGECYDPPMLRVFGYTQKNDLFFMNHDEEDLAHGLTAGGFVLPSLEPCASGGLQDRQGMIFVR